MMTSPLWLTLGLYLHCSALLCLLGHLQRFFLQQRLNVHKVCEGLISALHQTQGMCVTHLIHGMSLSTKQNDSTGIKTAFLAQRQFDLTIQFNPVPVNVKRTCAAFLIMLLCYIHSQVRICFNFFFVSQARKYIHNILAQLSTETGIRAKLLTKVAKQTFQQPQSCLIYMFVV